MKDFCCTMRVLFFVPFFLAFLGSSAAPLVLEGVFSPHQRLKAVKAAEDFIKSVEQKFNQTVAEILDRKELRDVLALNVHEIDPNTEATETAYVIAKHPSIEQSYLAAPLAVSEHVISDILEFNDAFVEILLPHEDGSEPSKANEEKNNMPVGEAVREEDKKAEEFSLDRFIRFDISESLPEEIRKSLESVQQALVYPSAFLTDLEEQIPIDVIFGLFKQIDPKLQEKQNEAGDKENKADEKELEKEKAAAQSIGAEILKKEKAAAQSIEAEISDGTNDGIETSDEKSEDEKIDDEKLEGAEGGRERRRKKASRDEEM